MDFLDVLFRNRTYYLTDDAGECIERLKTNYSARPTQRVHVR